MEENYGERKRGGFASLDRRAIIGERGGGFCHIVLFTTPLLFFS
jgi:hypothetical protein